MQLDIDAVAARRSSSSTRALAVEQRIRYAYNIGVNNIAEGLTDDRDPARHRPARLQLVAFGAAGPMLLPAVLDLVHAKRGDRPAAPGPVLGARPAQLRSGLRGQPQRLHDPRRRRRRRRSTQLFTGDGGPAAGAVRGRHRRRVEHRSRSFDGRLRGPDLGDAVHLGSRRRDHGRTRSTDDDRQLPRRLRERTGQPLRRDAGPGRDLPRAGDDPDRRRSPTAELAGREAADRRVRSTRVTTAHLAGRAISRPPNTTAPRCMRGDADRGPADDPRAAVDHLHAAGPGRARRRYGELSDPERS